MSRYIDADKIEYTERYVGMDEFAGWQTIAVKSDIDKIPTADVAEVVRCKDCKHWGGVTFGFVCRKFSGIDTKICMGADHYCSYGERSEGNDLG